MLEFEDILQRLKHLAKVKTEEVGKMEFRRDFYTYLYIPPGAWPP